MQSVSPASLMTIGATSTRWPALETLQWQAMRQVIAACRDAVAKVGDVIDATRADQDLTDEAKQRRVATAALQGIADLAELPSLAKAERLVADFLAGQAERRPMAIKAPSSPHEVAIAAEIRAWIASQSMPFGAAHNKMSDPRVASAILTAPAFLAGLTDEQHGTLRQAAEEAIDPEAVGIRKQNTDALEECRRAVVAARERIGKAANLRKTVAGEWQAHTVAKAA